MLPTKRITDPTFKYTDAASTDIRKLFDRVRRELAAQAKPPIVTPIRKTK